jgi:hypothetical protein
MRGRRISSLIPAGVKSRFWNWVDSGRKFDFAPSEAVTRRIKEYYRADNDVLSRKYGITL